MVHSLKGDNFKSSSVGTACYHTKRNLHQPVVNQRYVKALDRVFFLKLKLHYKKKRKEGTCSGPFLQPALFSSWPFTYYRNSLHRGQSSWMEHMFWCYSLSLSLFLPLSLLSFALYTQIYTLYPRVVDILGSGEPVVDGGWEVHLTNLACVYILKLSVNYKCTAVRCRLKARRRP